jgi:tetratricopeptide (TPR) repeat protein
MIENPDNQRLLRRAHLLLEEGQSNEALSILEKIQPDNEEQQNELRYLQGWYYLLQRRWNDAIEILSPLSNSEGKVDEENYSSHALRAFSLLRLGDAATNLRHDEDAARHYGQCLRILQGQRVNRRSIRIKALYGLASTCTMRGLHSPALQYYREALALCRDEVDDEDRANIYYGLCYTYRMVGKLLEALDVGREALQLYERMANRPLEGRMRNVLGRIYYLLGDYKTASDHYTVALAIAISYQGHAMVMLNYTALADLCLAEDRLEDAKRYCTLAQEIAEHLDNDHLCGLVYFAVGKVVEAEAQLADREQRQELLEEAVERFEKAKELLSRTQAYSDIAEVNWRLAGLLEKLGRDQEALECWKSAYQVGNHAKGSG